MVWLWLPTGGGYYDQDDFIFTVWQIVRNAYIEAMNDESVIKTIKARNEREN